MNASKGPGDKSVKAEIVEREILMILTVYQIWRTGNLRETVTHWHTLLNDKFINDQFSLSLMYGMVYDTLHGFDGYNDFVQFLRWNEPALPPPHHKTICSLLESLHGRVSALEKLR